MKLPRVASLSRGLRVIREAGGCLQRESRWRKRKEGARIFKREGTYIYPWLILDVWQKSAKFCKAIILHLKNKKKS